MKVIANAAFEQKAVVSAVLGLKPVKGGVRPDKWHVTLECGHTNEFVTLPGKKSFCRQCINEYMDQIKKDRVTADSVA